MGVFLVCLHLLFCAAAKVLLYEGIFQAPGAVMTLAWFVPVWGPACLLVLELRTRFFRGRRTETAVERLKINDEVYRSILMEEDPAGQLVVPIEEALIINDPAERRKLMMEVMYANPDDYVAQLMEARMNDDTEVVHYAVTALTELQKEYDLAFQRLERERASAPKDGRLLQEEIELVERYLNSGLLSGNERRPQLLHYSRLLKERLEQNGESMQLLCRKAEADLERGACGEAMDCVRRMIKLRPWDERGYLFLLRCHAVSGNRAGIDEVLAALKDGDIYLSPEGRGQIAFWQREETL